MRSVKTDVAGEMVKSTSSILYQQLVRRTDLDFHTVGKKGYSRVCFSRFPSAKSRRDTISRP